MFKSIGILKLVDIYKLNVAMYIYRVLNNNLYPTLQTCIDLRLPRGVRVCMHVRVCTPVCVYVFLHNKMEGEAKRLAEA